MSMKTVNPLFFDKLLEGKQSFCAVCMKHLEFWNCAECKIPKMVDTVRKTVEEEMTAEEKASIKDEVFTYYGMDLPGEMIKTIGKGPRTEEGFKASPFFVVSCQGSNTPEVKVKLIEKTTGFPECESTETTEGSHEKAHYVIYQTERTKSDVLLWDLERSILMEELRTSLERITGVKINWLWGIKELPFIDQYLQTHTDTKSLSEALMSRIRIAQFPDAYGCFYTEWATIATPRFQYSRNGSLLGGQVDVRLGKATIGGNQVLFLETKNTIAFEFTDSTIVIDEESLKDKLDSTLERIAHLIE